MGRLSEFLQNLFNKENNKQAQIPFLHEAIDIKSYPIEAYLEWHKLGRWQEFSESIQNVYRDKLITGKSSNGKLSTMQSQYSSGFIIHCAKHKYSDTDYKHLAYHLQSKTKKIGYTLNLAEVKSQKKGNKIETITKYYLKPSLKVRFDNQYDKNKANQLYGNITIQYTTIDSNPFEFKLMAKAYQDSKFFPPLDFDGLIDGFY